MGDLKKKENRLQVGKGIMTQEGLIGVEVGEQGRGWSMQMDN